MRTAILFLSLLPILCGAAVNEFFAMDNGLRDVKTLAGKAELLKELGYDGVTWRPGNTAEAVREMSARGIKMHALKISLPVSKDEKPPQFPLADLEAVKGTGAVLWVGLQSEGGGDADAARALRQLNAVAKPMGLRIALYPHIDTHTETLEDALRVADLADDDNIGVSLTLCHQLKIQGVQDLAPLLKRALPKLFLVQISGADRGDTKAMGWDKLIQPLGQGSYDVGSLLNTLQELDYQGPIGVIGFGLKQPARDHLGQSIDFWRKATAKTDNAERSALVFLIAGQSNAGGCGVLSPEVHRELGRHKKRPLVQGSTASEIGLSTDAADYTHSFMWVPGKGFQHADPETNLRPAKPDEKWHGMELPVIRELEKRFPDNDIFVVKHARGGTNLHRHWNPERQDGEYATWLGYYREATAQLGRAYPEVRVIGLYWDQGESDGAKADDYAKNLANFVAAVRRDTNVPGLRFFIRKHTFNWPNIDQIIAAQEALVAGYPRCHLLDIDLGSREMNYQTWAYSPGNGHVSSKGFVELTERLFEGPLRDATIESFDNYQVQEKTADALVFLIAGQSNAGGVAAFSPETNAKSGMAEKHPTIPGSTAAEVGIPTDIEAYPRCHIWGRRGFERLTPGKNLKGGYNDPNRHGIELPMAMLLEKKYPEADKFFIKHGPGGHNLHTQWKAVTGPDYKNFKGQLDSAMADLKKRYKNVRVIGLYWDQGESDRPKAKDYGKNLRAVFAAFREETGIPELPIFVRKHLFQHGDESFEPILEAQVEVTREDPHAHLLDLDLGSNAKNFKAWAWTDKNGHLSSKAYLELSRRIMNLAGKN